MGLFSRKKKIEVPTPPSEDLLRFPKPSQIEKIIEPEKPSFPLEIPPVPKKIKAEGVEEPGPPPDISIPETPPALFKPVFPSPPERPPPFTPSKPSFMPQKPCFLRVQHYQTLLDALADIQNNVKGLDQINKDLSQSEFHENKDHERLKNNLKRIHDRLISMDDSIFKK